MELEIRDVCSFRRLTFYEELQRRIKGESLMLTPMYSVRDEVAGSFAAPVLRVNDGVAKRDFADMVRQPGKDGQPNKLAQDASDYALYRVGCFDAERGVVVVEEPTRLCSAAEYVR